MLYRSALVRADTPGRTIYGTAVPFWRPAEVNDGRGPYREQFAPGSFARSIRERGQKIKLFSMHATRALPIGRATQLAEQADGLHVAFAVPHTRDGDEALELVASGTVDGFSIGFKPIRERREGDGTITRLEVALHEVSLVHTPAYDGALIAGVRSAQPAPYLALARHRLALIEAALPKET